MAEEELPENPENDAAALEACEESAPDEGAACDGATDAASTEGEEADEPGDADETGDASDDDASGGSDGYEEVEIEFDEDDIEAYIVDEDDNEIGFIMLDEDGNEVEYYYTDDEGSDEEEDEDNPYDLGITREGVAEATSDMNDIYRDGIAIASELKEALTDIQDAFDFSDILPGKKKK